METEKLASVADPSNSVSFQNGKENFLYFLSIFFDNYTSKHLQKSFNNTYFIYFKVSFY